MDKNSTTYTFGFALVVCVVCSLALASISEGLRSKKELNEVLDIKKNILKAVSLKEPVDPKATPEELLKVYDAKIQELVIDSSGKVAEGRDPHSIKEGESLYPLYLYKEGSAVVAYCFPIKGKGLWSTLYGYLAIESDAITVRGISYYKHGETPGLGAEIEKDWFQDNFKGKKIWDVDLHKLMPTAVVKGKVAEKIKDPKAAQYYVDGISGATMTSKGVTEMLDRELHKYESYLKTVRKAG